MKNFRKSIRYFIRGMGYGSITYLVIATFFTSNMIVSKTSVITVFIFSGLIGELSCTCYSPNWDLYPIFWNDVDQSLAV